MDLLQKLLRDVPDFPRPGILFKDITPLLRDAAALAYSGKALAAPFANAQITLVAGMEARGFIFGSLAARELGCGFVPLRKPGKLPWQTKGCSYDLEYGSASLEAHIDAFTAGDRVLLVDDVIATGGTAAASCRLIESFGATVSGCAFLLELEALGGRRQLGDRRLHALLSC